MYNSFCVLTDYSKIFTTKKRPTDFKNLISGCGSVWGRFRAPPVAEEARKKEWRNKEYCETTVSKTTMLQQGTFPSAAGGGRSEEKGVAQQGVLRNDSEQDDYVATGRA